MKTPAILLAFSLALAGAAPACAQTGADLMKQAETAMTSDPTRAATLVEDARAAFVREAGERSAEVALADFRLALIRALGGDRAGQLRVMADAADRLAARATTPQHRTWAGSAQIVAASFTMSSGEPVLTDRLRDAGMAILGRDDLARTGELAEALRVVADVLVFQNRPTEALPWSDRSIALYEAVAPDDPALVYALARRGSVYQRLSRYPEALADLRRSVAHSDRAAGDDPVARLYAFRALGNYYWRLAEPELALPLLTRALQSARGLPPGFPYSGGLTRDIMQVLIDSDRDEDARAYAEETATTTKATMGPASYEYASALLSLARLDIDAREAVSAEGRIAEAEGIFAKSIAADNSRHFESVAARAALLASYGRGRDAAALYDRAGAMIAHMPADDADRIDLAEGAAAVRLAGEGATDAGWTSARTAADGLTVRIVRQMSGVGVIDTSRRRSDRVYGTALDLAWSRLAARGNQVASVAGR